MSEFRIQNSLASGAKLPCNSKVRRPAVICRF